MKYCNKNGKRNVGAGGLEQKKRSKRMIEQAGLVGD